MTKVVTTEEMRMIERAADAAGVSYDDMMANAGVSIADAILSRWTEVKDVRVLVLVGPGNNGGDGLVAAHHLLQAGACIELYLSHPRSIKDDQNFARVMDAGVTDTLAEDDDDGEKLREAVRKADLLIDALLGTGVKLPLRGTPEAILSATKETISDLEDKPYIVAVDCPSGLDCDNGQIAKQSLRANLTVTLAAAKPGLYEFPGASSVGEIEVSSIGVPADQPEIFAVTHFLAEPDLLSTWLPFRSLDAHKGTFGRVVIIAGSINYPGAAALAGLGAYRSGAGLVTLAVPANIEAFLVPVLPEATWIALPNELGVISKAAASVLSGELNDVSALLIGPGFGREPTTQAFIQELFRPAEEHAQDIELPPLVVDADGLKLLSTLDQWSNSFQRTAILTPHPGEFAIMTGLTIGEVLEDRIKHVRRFSHSWGHVIVLKGAHTLIASPDGRLATVPIATPALATAGTGDVLAGVILALRGQGMDAFEAAVLGAYVHARAGVLAAEAFGATVSVIAGDVVEYLPQVFTELTNRLK